LAGARIDFEAIKNYTFTPQGRKEIDIPEFPGLIDIFKSGVVEEAYKKSPKQLKDSRIKAFFAICPAVGQGYTEKSQFKEVDRPLYIVDVEGDSITPYKTNALHYHQLIPASKFLLIPGKAGHYVFLNEAAEPVKKEAPVYFTDDPSVDRHAIHQQVGELAVEFFKENLK
jgi:predicted dienelactone hydrolase